MTILPEPCFSGGGGTTYAAQEENINQKLSNDLSDIQIYPNPFQDHFEFICPPGYKGNPAYSIIDTKGTTLVSKQQLNSNIQSVNLEAIPSGIYFIRIQDETKTIVRKILKQ